jgi:hypothetical protein
MALNPIQDVSTLVQDITGVTAGGVTNVTGAAPITSTGTNTPQIGLTTPLAVVYGGTGGTVAPVLTDGSRPLTANWAASNSIVTPESITSANSQNTLNIVAYGADPTGAADSTTAVTNALAALPANGGSIYVPYGIYKLASAVTVSKAVKFFGDGYRKSEFSCASAVDAFNITVNTDFDVVFEDLGFTTTSNADATAGAFIHGNAAANFPLYVERCWFEHAFNAIQLNSNWFSVIRACVFTNTAATNGSSIWINNLVNVDQGDNLIEGCVFLGVSTYQIHQTAGGGTRILSNKFVAGVGGSTSFTGDLAAGSTSDLLFHGNSFEANVSVGPIKIAPAGGVYNNILIQANQIVVASGATGVTIAPTGVGTVNAGMITANQFSLGANHVVFNPAAVNGANIWDISENVFNQPSVAAITLPATAGNTVNLRVGMNHHIQLGTAPYISGAFSSSSGFDPGMQNYFSQTANSTTTANTPTTMLGAGSGTLTIPAGRLMIGTRVRLRLAGFQSVADGGAATKVLVFSLGGTALVTTTGVAYTVGLNQMWYAEATFTCRSTGATGTVMGSVTFTAPAAANSFAASLAAVTINTTTALVINLTYNNGNATGVLTTTEGTLELLDARAPT